MRLKTLCGDADGAGRRRRVGARGAVGGRGKPGLGSAGAWVDIPPYQVDVLVRGSESLAKTKDGRAARTVL